MVDYLCVLTVTVPKHPLPCLLTVAKSKCREVSLSYIGAHGIPLVSHTQWDISMPTVEDLEGEDSADDLALLGLSPLSHQQKSYLTEHAKLAQIGE